MQTEKTSVKVSGILKLSVNVRKSRVKDWRSFYATLDRHDVLALGLQEGDRLTLGIIKIERLPEPEEGMVQS